MGLEMVMYPHEDLAALEAASSQMSAGEMAKHRLRGSLAVGIGRLMGTCCAAEAAWQHHNGVPDSLGVEDRHHFAGLVRKMGYTAPQSHAFGPKRYGSYDPQVKAVAASGRESMDPRCVVRPRYGSGGRDMYFTQLPETAVRIAGSLRGERLIQSYEPAAVDLRVWLHRDTTDLKEGRMPTWGVMLKRELPWVVGDGESSVNRLIRDSEYNESFRLSAETRRDLALHSGVDITEIVPAGQVQNLLRGRRAAAFTKVVEKTGEEESDEERANLTRFMGRFLTDFEMHLNAECKHPSKLNTVGFDIGLREPDTLKGPYDEHALRHGVIFYGQKHMPDLSGYIGTLPKPSDEKLGDHRVFGSDVAWALQRSVMASGILLRQQVRGQ